MVKIELINVLSDIGKDRSPSQKGLLIESNFLLPLWKLTLICTFRFLTIIKVKMWWMKNVLTSCFLTKWKERKWIMPNPVVQKRLWNKNDLNVVWVINFLNGTRNGKGSVRAFIHGKISSFHIWLNENSNLDIGSLSLQKFCHDKLLPLRWFSLFFIKNLDLLEISNSCIIDPCLKSWIWISVLVEIETCVGFWRCHSKTLLQLKWDTT